MIKRNAKTNVFILKSPRVTEKASMLAEKNIFVFNVDLSADAKSVAKAVEAQYKVKPERVNIIRIRAKNTNVKNRLGKTTRGKKAYVFLKKGDTLKLI